jgi:hypothetical protein
MLGAPCLADARDGPAAVDRLAEGMKVLRIAGDEAAAARGAVKRRHGQRGGRRNEHAAMAKLDITEEERRALPRLVEEAAKIGRCPETSAMVPLRGQRL